VPAGQEIVQQRGLFFRLQPDLDQAADGFGIISDDLIRAIYSTQQTGIGLGQNTALRPQCAPELDSEAPPTYKNAKNRLICWRARRDSNS
jgi:hypothetical protein